MLGNYTSRQFLVRLPLGLRLWAPNAGGLGVIPGQGRRSWMQQLKEKKILRAPRKRRDPLCRS